ncbi:hypothetical protein SmaMPs15_000220 [Stenotrophomonas maltophilia phage vB_SmaM_Ps15]|uniref:Uncharacterized protein n=1 Tax=Stenotrophomonas maltophilia phage vB_SmaM_Ps15 TaxID=3071007 RepID=A0AAE9JVD2_9CAUD|nr:hypothetical protein PQC01_gp258 [Stenotrophomonas maltophilia phage vB_SmaM_Ps15]UMO77371.1 hypothetical protein SmaMPs15_000220 [Stenotrophomonas maltophilia phage vB_SmaM_Ps15]
MDSEHDDLLMIGKLFKLIQTKVEGIKAKLGGGEVQEPLPTPDQVRRNGLTRYERMLEDYWKKEGDRLEREPYRYSTAPSIRSSGSWATDPYLSANPVVNPALFVAIF